MEYFAILPVFSEFRPSVKVPETGYFVIFFGETQLL